MSHVLDALLLALGLLVGMWMLVFGLLGLILSERAGLSRSAGVLIGIALGPIGAGWMIWRSRRNVTERAVGLTSSDPGPDDSDSGLVF